MYLKTIINKRQHFISLAENIFGLERLTDTSFVYFLASELNTNDSKLKRSISRWIHSGMEEVHGKSGLPSESRQKIYNIWVDNSIPSTDNRNDRCSVKMSKAEYLKIYEGIENNGIEIEEKVNKRG